MGLPREVSVAWFAERRAWTSGRFLQQFVEAGPRDHQEAVCGACARDGQATEGRVELIEF